MTRTIGFLIIFFASGNFVCAQNLVLNGSFESFNKCPGSYVRDAREFNILHWSTVGLGTPDHFHGCSIGEAGVPLNWAGKSNAQEGEGYAGIYAWMDYAIDYREYLQGTLVTPLIKDSTYYISFYYRLSTYSMYAIDRIGLLLVDTAMRVKHDRVIKEKPTFEVIHEEALTKETGLWEHAFFKYVAKGGENFLIIGNFNDKNSCNYYRIQYAPVMEEMLSLSAYYYIDNVSVISPYSAIHSVPTLAFQDVDFDTPYILSDVQFETNKYRLYPSSFVMLDSLIDYLHKHPALEVLVSGHTDDVGNESYNQRLSEQRAHTVKLYLIRGGISEYRIRAKGYGMSQPLSRETTEWARRANRRVEIKFLSNKKGNQ
jgi:OOP family OmpA-OmpF porin